MIENNRKLSLRTISRAMIAAAVLLLASCASTDEQPAPASRPAAETAARPEVRPLQEVAPAAKAAPDLVARPAPAPKPQAKPRASGAAPQFQYYRPAPVMAAPPPATFPGIDRFPDKEPTGVVSVAEHPVSTFSVDVDTASYAFVRRYLTAGRMPPREAVRVEEMVNYFPYAYPGPQDRTQPFRITHSVMPSPWAAENQLLHIAIKGYDIARAERPRANVVLLIDTSGSMAPQDRLPLLQQGFRLFAAQLRDDDRVAIVTYAGDAQTALEPTAGSQKQKIVDVIDGLHASGSTAGGEGLQRAYALAERHFDPNAVNRVILATDGDFNVGITDPKALERFIADKRKTGIYLSIFGVGLGNLNDALMQRLAQAGNGNAAYIDSLLEARKAMSEEVSSTLFPIADDVKVQVEFNPPGAATSRLIEQPVRAVGIYDSLERVPAEQRFAVAVAAFAQRLRGESAVDGYTYGSIAALANTARGPDPEGYRAEFIRLVRLAETMGAVGRSAP